MSLKYVGQANMQRYYRLERLLEGFLYSEIGCIKNYLRKQDIIE